MIHIARVLDRLREGGVGSGHWGHAGRKGQRGGSMPSGQHVRGFLNKVMHGLTVGSGGFKGITISRVGDVPAHGYVVGGAGEERIIDATTITGKEVMSYVGDNFNSIAKANHYFGAWVDSGKCYFDVSTVRAAKSEALAEGRVRDQIAIWGIDEGEPFNTMSDGKRPSESSGDPITEAQKRAGPTLLLFGADVQPDDIAAAIRKEAASQGGRSTIKMRPQGERQ